MEVEMNLKTKVDIKTLHVKAGARYWEDATVNGVEDTEGDLIPCRNGDYWEPIIDVETGKIINWKEGAEADIHYKVCDDGTYTLKDAEGKIIASKDGYVPDIMCPEKEGYGDYIKMKIDKNGIIANFKATFAEFTDQEN